MQTTFTPRIARRILLDNNAQIQSDLDSTLTGVEEQTLRVLLNTKYGLDRVEIDLFLRTPAPLAKNGLHKYLSETDEQPEETIATVDDLPREIVEPPVETAPQDEHPADLVEEESETIEPEESISVEDEVLVEDTVEDSDADQQVEESEQNLEEGTAIDED